MSAESGALLPIDACLKDSSGASTTRHTTARAVPRSPPQSPSSPSAQASGKHQLSRVLAGGRETFPPSSQAAARPLSPACCFQTMENIGAVRAADSLQGELHSAVHVQPTWGRAAAHQNVAPDNQSGHHQPCSRPERTRGHWCSALRAGCSYDNAAAGSAASHATAAGNGSEQGHPPKQCRASERSVSTAPFGPSAARTTSA